MEHHIIYAVTDDLARHRLSDPLDWNTAQRRWDRLDRARLRGRRQTIDGVPVRYFAVRSADDPEWPSVLATRRCVETAPDRPYTAGLRKLTDGGYVATVEGQTGTGPNPLAALGDALQAARRTAII